MLKKEHFSSWLIYIIPPFLFLLHLPFLLSDPDGMLSFSRGIFTDEGYYTIQLRNWLNHGYWGYWDVDAFVKTPLFNALLTPVMFIFGTKILVARLTILILSIFLLVTIARKLQLPWWILVFSSTTLLLPHVFQFMHLALAEILAGMLILTGIAVVAATFQKTNFDEKWPWKWILLIEFIFAAVYWLKNQYLYTIPITPLLILAAFLCRKDMSLKLFWKLVLSVITVKMVLLSLYFLLWYLPNRELYDFMMRSNENRLIEDNFTGLLQYNVKHLFRLSELRHFYYLFFPIALTAIPFAFFVKNNLLKFLFLAGWIWFGLEMHKFLFVYIPGRFLVTLLLAGGLIFSTSVLILARFFLNRKQKILRWLALIPAMVALWILIANIAYITSTWEQREFILHETNQYVARHLPQDAKMIGVWSASLNWDAGVLAIPVTHSYHQGNPILVHQPALIISEPGQSESNQLFNHYNIDLGEISDSIKRITLEEYTINLYWISKFEKHER